MGGKDLYALEGVMGTASVFVVSQGETFVHHRVVIQQQPFITIIVS